MRSSERVQLQDRTVLLWENRQLEDNSRQLMISWWCTISTCWHRHHRHLVLTGLRVKSWDDQAIALQRGKRCKRNQRYQRALSKWHWFVGHRTMFFFFWCSYPSEFLNFADVPAWVHQGWQYSHATSLKSEWDKLEIWVWVKIRYPNNWMGNTKLD